MSKLTREEVNEMIEQMVTEKVKEFSSKMRDIREEVMDEFCDTLYESANKIGDEVIEKYSNKEDSTFLEQLQLIDMAVTPYEAFRTFLEDTLKALEKEDIKVSAEVAFRFIYHKYMRYFNNPLFVVPDRMDKALDDMLQK